MATEIAPKPIATISGKTTASAVTIAVSHALDTAGQHAASVEFWNAAMPLDDRDQVIDLAKSYVEVQT